MQAVGNALYGLQGMSSDALEVRQLVSVLTRKIDSCTEPLDVQAVGNALYGLQGLSSDALKVTQLISVLARKIDSCTEPLRAREAGNALYGLQGMSSDVLQVRQLVSVLSRKIDSCTEPLEVQAVGNALYGLQGMSSDALEVRRLVSVLSRKIDSCTEPLDAQAVGNALYGLQGMSSDALEVRQLVSVLTRKIDSRTKPLDGQAVGNALYGLQRLSSVAPEVRNLVALLAQGVIVCDDQLSLQAIGMGLLGLSNMDMRTCLPAAQLTSELADQGFAAMFEQGHGRAFDSRCDTLAVGAVSHLLNCSSHCPTTLHKLLELVAMCTRELNKRNSKSRPAMSESESRLIPVAEEVAAMYGASVSANAFLHCFDRDIVISATMALGAQRVINVEIDGAHHASTRQKRMDDLRDRWLVKQGVEVHRWSLLRPDGHSKAAFRSWLQGIMCGRVRPAPSGRAGHS